MTRNSAIDIVKGVGILAVIVGHCIPYDCWAYKFIYTFHMPLFFIVAGFLYKPTTLLKSKFIADFRRLIVPYLIIALSFTIYLLIKENDKLFALKYSLIATLWATGWNHASLIWSTAPHIGIAWFLPSLFWCRQFYNFIYTKAKYRWWIIFCISLITTLIDYYLINLPLGFLTGSSAMVFYLIGHCSHHIKIKRQYLIIVGAVCWIIQLNFGGIDMCFCSYTIYPVDIIGATFASATIYYGAQYLSNTSWEKGLANIGKSSLYIYCFHAIENEIKPYEWLPFHDSLYIEIPARIITCLTAAYIFVSIKEKIFKR